MFFFLERIQRIERTPALGRRIARGRSNANLQRLSFKYLISYPHFYRIDRELAFLFRDQDINETFAAAGPPVHPLKLRADIGPGNHTESLQARDPRIFRVPAVFSRDRNGQLKLILYSYGIAAHRRRNLDVLSQAQLGESTSRRAANDSGFRIPRFRDWQICFRYPIRTDRISSPS